MKNCKRCGLPPHHNDGCLQCRGCGDFIETMIVWMAKPTQEGVHAYIKVGKRPETKIEGGKLFVEDYSVREGWLQIEWLRKFKEVKS